MIARPTAAATPVRTTRHARGSADRRARIGRSRSRVVTTASTNERVRIPIPATGPIVPAPDDPVEDQDRPVPQVEGIRHAADEHERPRPEEPVRAPPEAGAGAHQDEHRAGDREQRHPARELGRDADRDPRGQDDRQSQPAAERGHARAPRSGPGDARRDRGRGEHQQAARGELPGPGEGVEVGQRLVGGGQRDRHRQRRHEHEHQRRARASAGSAPPPRRAAGPRTGRATAGRTGPGPRRPRTAGPGSAVRRGRCSRRP